MIMVLLAVTADTWIVTGLGFGIVLVLLFCLVYILQAFGWIMTSAEKGFSCSCKCKKEETKANAKAEPARQEPSSEEKAAIAMAISEANNDDLAAVAYALYLAQDKKHDIPTAIISLHKHETAWNEKSIGMNNVGF